VPVAAYFADLLTDQGRARIDSDVGDDQKLVANI
jgi:hypothetical protein